MPERNTATSMNPGLNIRSDVFSVDVPFDELVAYYARCFDDPGERDDVSAWFVLPLDEDTISKFPEASRTLIIEHHEGASRVSITCDGCY